MDIVKIHEAIRNGIVNISEHADEELENDTINDDELYYSGLNGEVIEDYADDRPFPSCLIYGKDKNNSPIHSVWAYSERHKIAVLITAYIPDSEKWIDYKIRKAKR
ncbi:MAG: DUF4258 domain-containing protein [Candidatus Methanoperedenaceae archaeon]|nr:DUF4258 domain-containing protein [Candidatus Methanoperedenaceae archaeon]